MTSGAAPSPTPGNGSGGRRGAGAWAWLRPAGIGVLLAALMLVLLAGLLSDLLPSPGGGVITGPTTPTPVPTVSVPEETPTPSATDGTGEGDGEGTGEEDGTGTGGGSTGGGPNNNGGGNNAGGNNNNGGGSNNNGGGNNGGGGGPSLPTRPGIPQPTRTPPTAPPLPTGPHNCTVYDPPGSCWIREVLSTQVKAGPLRLVSENGAARANLGAELVGLRPSGTTAFGPSVSGELKPMVVEDYRGGTTGWDFKASVAWPGGVPDGVLVTVDPWCRPIENGFSAPGLTNSRTQQLVSQPASVCSKDDQVGEGGATSGAYVVGGTVSVSTWIGTPIPATAVLVTFAVE